MAGVVSEVSSEEELFVEHVSVLFDSEDFGFLVKVVDWCDEMAAGGNAECRVLN